MEEDDLSPFAMIQFLFGDSDAALTIMSRGKRFHISIATEDLRGTHGDELVQKFLDYKKNMNDVPHIMEEFMDWMVKPCISYMDRFKPPTPREEPPSLAEYFAPETVVLKLANKQGRLKATLCPEETSDTYSATPKIALSDPLVQEATSQGIPLIPAAQLKAVLGPEAHEADYDLIPTTVQMIGEETSFHFKGTFIEQCFHRELDMLLRLRSDIFPDDMRVSRLGGLVLSSDGGSVLGLLVEYICDSKTLDEAVEGSEAEERGEWMRQLRDTVEQLHAGGIVWDDVKPHNILVDSNSDVWVIDFGGGCAGGVEGVEGDLEGLSRIATFLSL